MAKLKLMTLKKCHHQIKKEPDETQEIEEIEEDENDDFENLYKGQVSKSGVAVLPSKELEEFQI